MKALSPSKLYHGKLGPEWYRLARTDDGVLCLECISDKTLNRAGEPPDWAFAGEAPPLIARQLKNDDSPDQVAKVLERAVRALGYPDSGQYPEAPGMAGERDAGEPDVVTVAMSPSYADNVDDPTLRALATETVEAGNAPVVLAAIGTPPLQVEIPGELVEAVDRYLAIPDHKDNRLAALNAVAYIGERFATIVQTAKARIK